LGFSLKEKQRKRKFAGRNVQELISKKSGDSKGMTVRGVMELQIRFQRCADS
jgi:hypothetical protein